MAGVPALSTNPSDYQGTEENADTIDGFEFAALQDVSVTALGLYVGTSCFTGSYEVGLWGLRGNLIASATVGPGDVINGAFAFHAITPVTLSGGDYVVAAMTDGALDEFGDTIPSDPRISVVEDRFSTSSSLAFPTSSDGADSYIEGGNLLLDPAFSEALALDTGASATDQITSVPRLTGATEAGSTVTISDGAAVLGTPLANAAANGTLSVRSVLADGRYTLTAAGTNTAGAPGSVMLNITLDATAPHVTEKLADDTGLSDTDGLTSDGALIGTGDPDAIVTLTEGSTVLGTTRANAAGAWTFMPKLADGAYTVVATETDAAGTTGSATLSFTLDTFGRGLFAELSDDTSVGPGAPSIGEYGITSDPSLFGALGTNRVAVPGNIVTLTEGGAVLATVTTDATGIWTYTPTLPDGLYTIVASATDAAGVTSYEVVSFTLNTTDPDLQGLLPPALTARLVDDTGVSAFDGITSNAALIGSDRDFNPQGGTVLTFTVDGTALGTTTITASTSGAWSFAPTLPDGTYTVTVSATDAAGHTDSAMLTFTLDATPPDVTETLAHDTGASASDRITSDPALTGTGDPNALVTLTEGSTILGTTTADGSGAWSFTPILADSTNTITASETDVAGNTGSAAVTFTLDATLPDVTETLANDTGASASDAITTDPTLTGTSDPNAVVTLTEGSTILGSTTADAAGVWSFTPALPDGPHTVIASETDLAANTGAATLSFTLEAATGPAPPDVTESLADDTAIFASGKLTSDPTLTGTGDPNALVTLTEASTVLGTTTADAAGVWRFTPTLPDGVHTVVASETNTAGDTGSATLSFTLDTPPDVTEKLLHDTGASDTDGITGSPELGGTGDPNAVVTLTANGDILGTTTADASGAWAFTFMTVGDPLFTTVPDGYPLADGTSTIVASETNAAGDIGSAALTITLDTAEPHVTEKLADDTGASPFDGLTADDTLTGTADPNAVVTLAVGNTTLGTTTTDASGAWSFTPTLADGTYRVAALETNLAGSFGSATLTFTLDATPPDVTESLAHDTGISASDGITSDPTVSGTGNANAVVTLTEGGTVLGTTTADASGAWSFTPTLADGAHTIVATETGMAGNTGSATLSFTLEMAAAGVTEALADDTGVSPSDGITSDPTLTGTSEPNAVVTLAEGGAVLGTATADATGVWSFTPTLPDGMHTVIATETEAAGSTGSATLSFTLDTATPDVTETLVDDTGISASDKITSAPALTGTGDPNAIVTLIDGSTVLGTTTADATGAWRFAPTLTDGTHIVVATEADDAGNTSSATLTFTLDTTAPVVTETLAHDTGVSASDEVTSDPTLTGTGSANAVVTLIEGSTVLGTTTADATGAWSFKPTLADGAHTIIATETSAAGDIGSATLTFTLDTAPPDVTETLVHDTGVSASDEITSDPALTGTGAANAVVTLTEGSTVLGTATADATGAWSFTPVLTDGAHTIVATETDVAGNTGSAMARFTLDTASPVVSSPRLTVDGNAAATPIGIAAPTDPNVPTSELTITASALPANGTVTLSNGAAVTTGETLTSAELTSLLFTPAPGQFSQSSSFTYTATDPANNRGIGTVTLAIAAPRVLAAPLLTTGDEITSDATPTIAGTAAPGSTVTLFADSVAIGSATADASTGIFAITPVTPLAIGTDSLTATATTAGDASTASVPIILFTVQAPVYGVSTTDFSSADLGAVLSQGASFAFVGGTEAVLLTDATLSVGPDTNEATLQRLYEGLLGRSGDAGGISFYDGLLTAGVSKATIASDLVNSNEYLAGHGTQTDQQFVTTLYQGLLGRSADADPGSSFWTGLLAQGASRGSVAAGIADSDEAKSHLAATTAQVFAPNAAGTLAHELYETGLGREVDLPALQNFQAAFAAETPAQFASGIAGSAEFAADHTGQSNAAYVNSLYEVGLGRPADPSGSAFWTELLGGGATRGDVLLDIATSGEANAHLTHNLSA
jgi:hypothetical protein